MVMSLLFEDQDAEGVQEASRRLGALFDTDDRSVEEDSGTTFKYEGSSPKPAARKGTRSGGRASASGGGPEPSPD